VRIRLALYRLRRSVCLWASRSKLGELGRLASLSGGLGLTPGFTFRAAFLGGPKQPQRRSVRCGESVGSRVRGCAFGDGSQKLGRDRAACEDCEARIGVLPPSWAD